MSIAKAMKQAAQAQQNAQAPAAIMFGVVTSAQPLKIMVDGRFAIEGKMLIVPKEFCKGQYETHKHQVFAPNPGEARTGAVAGPGGGVPPTGVEEHSHILPDTLWTNNGDNSLKGKEIYYGLAVGEKVVLLRNHGGQEYLVLGRV